MGGISVSVSCWWAFIPRATLLASQIIVCVCVCLWLWRIPLSPSLSLSAIRQYLARVIVSNKMIIKIRSGGGQRYGAGGWEAGERGLPLLLQLDDSGWFWDKWFSHQMEAIYQIIHKTFGPHNSNDNNTQIHPPLFLLSFCLSYRCRSPLNASGMSEWNHVKPLKLVFASNSLLHTLPTTIYYS